MNGMEASFSLAGMWESMTPVGKGVVIALALMSVWSLTIAFERLWRFRKARTSSMDVALAVTPLLRDHRLAEAISATKDWRFHDSHLARVLAAGLVEFQVDALRDLPADFDVVESGKRALEREAMLVVADMRKGLGTLATISTTAPFIGLFGTVIGIINAFRGMAISGSGGLGAVSAGIAEALATTAFGLIVAVPAVWMYNYFVGRIERFQVEMSSSSSQLVDYFVKNEARARARA